MCCGGTINLCENRYHFLVTFAACATLGQISLFPSSKAKKEIEKLSESYFNSYLINDEDVIDLYQFWIFFGLSCSARGE
jgi:hypothetical protein